MHTHMPQLKEEHLAKAKKRASKLGVTVELSTLKNKKLDVFKKGKKIASVGDTRYSDFLQHGDPERRKRYKARHQKDRTKVGSPGYYADKLLW